MAHPTHRRKLGNVMPRGCRALLETLSKSHVELGVHLNLDNVTLVYRTPRYCHPKLRNQIFWCKTPSLLSLSPLTLSLCFPKNCSVSVIITSNVDERRLDGQQILWMTSASPPTFSA